MLLDSTRLYYEEKSVREANCWVPVGSGSLGVNGHINISGRVGGSENGEAS